MKIKIYKKEETLGVEFVGKIVNLCKSYQELEFYSCPVIDPYRTEDQEGKVEIFNVKPEDDQVI